MRAIVNTLRTTRREGVGRGDEIGAAPRGFPSFPCSEPTVSGLRTKEKGAMENHSSLILNGAAHRI